MCQEGVDMHKGLCPTSIDLKKKKKRKTSLVIIPISGEYVGLPMRKRFIKFK